MEITNTTVVDGQEHSVLAQRACEPPHVSKRIGWSRRRKYKKTTDNGKDSVKPHRREKKTTIGEENDTVEMTRSSERNARRKKREQPLALADEENDTVLTKKRHDTVQVQRK